MYARLCLGAAAAFASLILLTSAPAAAQSPATCQTGDPTAIQTGSGIAVCGQAAPQNPKVYEYLGIPYAQPPVGSARWQTTPRQDLPASGGVQRIAIGNWCPQAVAGDSNPPMGEDCLYLNVWAPAAAINGGASLPVMVFIHGGAFVSGSGGSPLYDGTALAGGATNMVVVTLNYRLGALGFLAAALTSGPALPTNLGITDQQNALAWVAANIKGFGGDPTKVTIFGESAGAMSVGLHALAMPGSSGLFRAALMESNPFGALYPTPAIAQKRGAKFLKALCAQMPATGGPGAAACPTTLAQLQASGVTTAMILAAQAKAGKALTATRSGADSLGEVLDQVIVEPSNLGLPWTPVIDGGLIVGEPINGFQSGTTPVPLAFGVNLNEGAVFGAMALKSLGAVKLDAGYPLALQAKFGLNILNNNARYRPDTYPAKTLPPFYDPTAAALSYLITDYGFFCGNVLAMNTVTGAANPPPVFGYAFTQAPFFDLYNLNGSNADNGACAPGTGSAPATNVCHGNELPYAFNNLSVVEAKYPAPSKGTDAALAGQMMAAWVAFAASPTAPGAAWSPYKAGASVNVWNGATPGTTLGLDAAAQCSSFWFQHKPYNGN